MMPISSLSADWNFLQVQVDRSICSAEAMLQQASSPAASAVAKSFMRSPSPVDYAEQVCRSALQSPGRAAAKRIARLTADDADGQTANRPTLILEFQMRGLDDPAEFDDVPVDDAAEFIR